MHVDNPTIDRVQEALDVYRSIAACNGYLSRGDDVHSLTAAMMLPAYRVQFQQLALRLTPQEESKLMTGLRQIEPRSEGLQDLSGYLGRLGFAAPPIPTLETLRELQARHTATFPFETLSTMLRAPVPVDLPSLERKILNGGRGGYCYELNRLYLALLKRLGFQARGVTGRVVMGGPEDAWTARTHLLVLVSLDEKNYISDVGFGGMVPTAPLALDIDEEQLTPHGIYRVAQDQGRFTLYADVAGNWRAMYVFDLQPQADIDFEVGNWYVSTHRDSTFLGQLVAAIATPGLRRTLHNGSYAIHRIGAASERRQLTDADEVINLLQTAFGIRVPQHPDLRSVLARLIA